MPKGYSTISDSASTFDDGFIADENEQPTIKQLKGPQPIQMVDRGRVDFESVSPPRSSHASFHAEIDSDPEEVGSLPSWGTRPIPHSESQQYFLDNVRTFQTHNPEAVEYAHHTSSLHESPYSTTPEAQVNAHHGYEGEANIHCPVARHRETSVQALETTVDSPVDNNSEYAMGLSHRDASNDLVPSGEAGPEFDIVNPTHLKFKAAERPLTMYSEVDPDAVYYPAPVPMQLRLPPLLSTRNQDSSDRPRRRRSVMLQNIPPPPQWDTSPLDREITSRRPEGGETLDYVYDDIGLDSDCEVNSDRATILSNDDYQDANDDEVIVQKGAPPARKSWLGSKFGGFLRKQGEEQADVDLAEQEAIQKKFDDLAFSRFDPELVDQHVRRFQSGGVYSGTVPSSGGVTSLIEELEIRKAGRRVQRNVVHREADEIRNSIGMNNRFAHPLDQEHQPTLLELQNVANQDYKQRVDWHRNAVHGKSKVSSSPAPNESLAQRRARLKAEKGANPTAGDAPPPDVTESLAQRRARLRQQKQFIRQSSYTPSVVATEPDLNGTDRTPDPQTPSRSVSPVMSQDREYFSPGSQASVIRAVALNI